MEECVLSALTEVTVPDIGTQDAVDVIEVLVAVGDVVSVDDPLINLESAKASMEVPSSAAGKVHAIRVKVGDKIKQGDVICQLEADAGSEKSTQKPSQSAPAQSQLPAPAPATQQTVPSAATPPVKPAAVSTEVRPATTVAPSTRLQEVYAGPAVRRLAREWGIDLSQVKGTGPRGRVVKEDLQNFTKTRLNQPAQGGGLAILPAPQIDFSQFGPITSAPLNKIKRLTAQYLHRNWVTIPHVTQFDEADITDMEAFRQANKTEAEEKGVRLTPLAFIMKASVAALKAFPSFNASLDASGEALILKQYYHIGVAVDTPNGLVVPVIRNVDQKGIYELADELAKISKKARDKGLTPADMSGSCFTLSSLGGIGGTAFTPIINAPDVAILGVSKAQMKPVYDGQRFVPRLMLPLSLSYDHRVIDGAEGARFIRALADCLADVRRMIL